MIIKIGNTQIHPHHNGSCHCGEGEFVEHLPNQLAKRNLLSFDSPSFKK